MAAAARAPNCKSFGTPHGIVVMVLSDQGMRNLVENCVADFLIRRAFGEFNGQRDEVRRVVTTARALGGMVKLEPPLSELMVRQHGSSPLSDGPEFVVIAAHNRSGRIILPAG
jgi:hypothetical protein